MVHYTMSWNAFGIMKILVHFKKGDLYMDRVEQNIIECWDEENKEFDWEYYQYLCDIQEEAGCKE